MDEARLREQICLFSRSLFERGLTHGTTGNVSVRLEDGGLLATPTDSSLGFLDPAQLTRLDAAGRVLSGDPPTKEIPLHAALYETRAAAGAIVHLHSTHSVALSMLPDVDPACVLPPLTAYSVMRVGRTALVPYYRPGDPAVAGAIRGLAGRYAAVLLANHGPVVAGRSIEAARGGHRGAGGDRPPAPDAARPEPPPAGSCAGGGPGAPLLARAVPRTRPRGRPPARVAARGHARSRPSRRGVEDDRVLLQRLHAGTRSPGPSASKAGLCPDPPGASRPWTGLTSGMRSKGAAFGGV